MVGTGEKIGTHVGRCWTIKEEQIMRRMGMASRFVLHCLGMTSILEHGKDGRLTWDGLLGEKQIK